MSKAAVTTKKKNKPKAAGTRAGVRQMAAGEFKAKVLGLIDEVNENGSMVVITKRGSAKAALVRYPASTGVSLLGRLQGKYSFHGDLLEPVFPLKDYDMLK
jgi:antitoxin (DNA-binding transcriptional repressor) of toxin-antitoxin stability system